MPNFSVNGFLWDRTVLKASRENTLSAPLMLPGWHYKERLKSVTV
jgi:hypothetical protein